MARRLNKAERDVVAIRLQQRPDLLGKLRVSQEAYDRHQKGGTDRGIESVCRRHWGEFLQGIQPGKK
jgi:hypothetical protein